MDFKYIPKEYRPIPFWSWNEKLDIDETKNQVDIMNDAGIGGFFMHARGGLQTDYMGPEWFENVSAAIDSAKENGMHAWAYDENGWPSGFGNGYVNGLGVEFCQKYLRMSDSKPLDNIICKCGNHWFYYDVNPYYVDTLDKDVTSKFIECAYVPYFEKFGNNLEGFFTDEPQISRNGIPWSFVFEKEYFDRYNENINEHLEQLFINIGDYKNTRIKFWKMVTDLFSQGFMNQIYTKCREWGLKLTGHLILEETLLSQLITNGACMPHYEYFDIPGMDWLGRNIRNCLTTMQLSSVSDQLGKKLVLSETFALCGHNVSFAELKGIYEWQMVHGINLLCQHLEGYSIRGIRKRDFPPAMYFQQPWWCEYRIFVDAMAREGMVIAKTDKYADVLLMHPQTTAWSLYTPEGDNDEIKTLNAELLNTMSSLENKHIMYHLGDETLLIRHAKVEDGKIVIGKQKYSSVILNHCTHLLDETKILIDEFVKSGGGIVTADMLLNQNVCSESEITYQKRANDEYTLHHFVNSSADTKKAIINVPGKKLDIYTGELSDFNRNYTFEPWGSLLVIDDNTPYKNIESVKEDIVKLDGEFDITYSTDNSLTLDKCDYYFDGQLQETNGYVLNICERANALERMVKIHQDYHVNINHIPNELYLVCETPEKFKISVNGIEIDKKVCGYFRDKSFKKLDIKKYLKIGENTISFDCDFVQSDEFYIKRRKAYVFETERNNLCYDFEIEAIYLVGDFSVETNAEWSKLDKNAVRYKGDFIISESKTKINIKNIEMQGFPFFCGSLCLEGEIDIKGDNPVLEIDRKGINVVEVEINDIKKVMICENRLSLSDFNVKGKTKIKLTITNNLRNLLGPHHLETGESYKVSPRSFFKEPSPWKNVDETSWNNDYCFVETGI